MPTTHAKTDRDKPAAKRTQTGREIEEALREVIAHVRGETQLPCRVIDDPAAAAAAAPDIRA